MLTRDPHKPTRARHLFSRSCAVHRSLHSFPTRRSSDLLRSSPGPRGDSPHRRSQSLHRRLGLPRSEEHTSELQSLRHLVCRLLLEKKNIFVAVVHLAFDTIHRSTTTCLSPVTSVKSTRS